MATADYSLVERTIREAIRGHIVEAWQPEAIYYDFPEEQPAALPVAMLLLLTVTEDEEEATLTFDAMAFEYQVIGRFPRPGVGSLHEARQQALTDLKLQLLASSRIVAEDGTEYNRDWLGDTLIDPESEAPTGAHFVVSTRVRVVARIPAV